MIENERAPRMLKIFAEAFYGPTDVPAPLPTADDPLNEIIDGLMQFRHACLKNGMEAPSKIVLDPESMMRLKSFASINRHLVWDPRGEPKTSLMGIEFVDG